MASKGAMKNSNLRITKEEFKRIFFLYSERKKERKKRSVHFPSAAKNIYIIILEDTRNKQTHQIAGTAQQYISSLKLHTKRMNSYNIIMIVVVDVVGTFATKHATPFKIKKKTLFLNKK